jgi:hypothetical protein
MGQVRDTIEDVAPARGRSPLVKLADVKDQLYDLLTIKKRDLEQEGDAQRSRNAAAVAKLESAIAAVKDAERSLEAY